MTPEQKQRIEQIRERLNSQGDSQVYGDIDFLLSIVESQEAGSVAPFCPVHAALEQRDGLVLEVGNDCVACSLNERTAILNLLEPFAPEDKSQDSLTVLHDIINGDRMRSKCIEKVQAMAGNGSSEMQIYWLRRAAKELESVTLQEQEK